MSNFMIMIIMTMIMIKVKFMIMIIMICLNFFFHTLVLLYNAWWHGKKNHIDAYLIH